MLTIVAFPAPLLNSYNDSPSSALNILITVPFTLAVAIKLPSAFTVNAPTSYSCAAILVSMLLSLT